MASVAWGCAVLLLASCAGEEVPAGLRPVGEDGFEVAIDEPRLRVDRSGIWVAGDGEPTLVLAAARLERGGVRVDESDLGALSLEPNRGSYPRGELGEEWYELRDGQAFEQGWSLTQAPAERGEGQLEIVLDLGEQAEVFRWNDEEIVIRMPNGEVSYSSLVAHDATGSTLAATMGIRDRAVVLSVDDSRAEYPIEIDPLIALALTGPLEAPDTDSVQYGYAVAIWGNSLFVGQPDLARDATNGLIPGAVHQYTRSGTTWSHVETIRVAGTAVNAAFGASIAVYDDWLVVGAPLEGTYGHAYAIRISTGFNGNGVPNTVQKIAPPVVSSTFGRSVTIAGTRLAISGSAAGLVFVYNLSGGIWSNTTTHRVSGSGGFGTSIALARNNANILVVGAPTQTTNGRVLIYRWNGTSWGTAATILPLSTPTQQTRFGVSVGVTGSLNAERVAIGCFTNSGGGTRAQLARTVYSSGTWQPVTIEIDGSVGGYVSTTEPFADNTDNWTPHVAIAPNPTATGSDILLLGLPNAVAASNGTGTVVGTLSAAPAAISAVQRLLPGEAGITHRGRSVATDGFTVAVGDRDSSGGRVRAHGIGLNNGDGCSLGTQCASGICVEGVCCNEACGTSTTDCQACSAALGATTNGVCSALTASFAPTVTCLASGGVCDPAETCTAGSRTCPANAFRPSSYQCGNSSGAACDAHDFCTGSSAICPNLVRANGYVCRPAAAGTCDRAETCNGSSSACPVDTPQDPGTPCGTDTTDLCDAPDVCDGSFVCPELAAPVDTLCRASVSACDAQERCNGTSIVCPANAPPRPAGTVCRLAAPSLACDVLETCTGNSYTCPADLPAPMGTTCRGAAGPCDLPETCNGSSFNCPTDARVAAGTTCRAAPGACDLPEVCDGTSVACPADLRRDALHLCRPASSTNAPGTSDCDVPEYCDGTAAACPTDTGASFAECCTASEWADGDQCRTDYLCVDATCTVRGCGDGWLEGSEICDDGNYADGDACSFDCAPTPFVVAARPDGIDEPGNRSVAIDGEGRVLVIWSEESDTVTRIRARRYTRHGTDPSGSPAVTEIASLPGPGWDAQPVVTALADGWAVAWRQPADAEVGAVAAARISETGVLGAAIRVSATTETLALDPGIAALSDGALIVTWTDATDPITPIIRYRWIVGSSVSGLPTALDSAAGGDAVVAASGTTAMIVWTEEPALLGTRPRIVARRITRTLPIDVTKVAIATNASQPTVAGGASHFAIGWVGREDDPDGDIFARVLPSSGAITGVGAHVTTVADADRPLIERAPSIVVHGTGWLIAWEVPTRRAARLAAGGGATLPSEQPSLDDGLHQHLSLASSSRGTWMVWSSVLDDPPVEHAEIVADADTYVSEGAPTTTYGTVGHLRAGRPGDTGGGATGRKDSYIHWDLSAFRGVTVVDASLRFAQSDAGNDPVGMSFLAAESPWAESTLTWATRVDPDGPVLASVVAPPVTVGSGLFEIGGSAVIGEVRRWTQAPSANFGIVVQMTDRDAGTSGDTLRSREYTVAGERPTLRFDYQRPPAARATWAFILPPS